MLSEDFRNKEELDMAVVSDHYFPSSNGTAQIRYRIWMPENCEVRAVIQLTHGIAEHIDR